MTTTHVAATNVPGEPDHLAPQPQQRSTQPIGTTTISPSRMPPMSSDVFSMPIGGGCQHREVVQQHCEAGQHADHHADHRATSLRPIGDNHRPPSYMTPISSSQFPQPIGGGSQQLNWQKQCQRTTHRRCSSHTHMMNQCITNSTTSTDTTLHSSRTPCHTLTTRTRSLQNHSGLSPDDQQSTISTQPWQINTPFTHHRHTPLGWHQSTLPRSMQQLTPGYTSTEASTQPQPQQPHTHQNNTMTTQQDPFTDVDFVEVAANLKFVHHHLNQLLTTLHDHTTTIANHETILANHEMFMNEQLLRNCSTADTLQCIFDATKELQDMYRRPVIADDIARPVSTLVQAPPEDPDSLPDAVRDDYELVADAHPPTPPPPQQHQTPPPSQAKPKARKNDSNAVKDELATLPTSAVPAAAAAPVQPPPPLHACMERAFTAMAAFGRRRQTLSETAPKKRGRPPKHVKTEDTTANHDSNIDINSSIAGTTTNCHTQPNMPLSMTGRPASTTPFDSRQDTPVNAAATHDQPLSHSNVNLNNLVEVESDSTEY
eukprot:5402405-Amphidinium_carterae.5